MLTCPKMLWLAYWEKVNKNSEAKDIMYACDAQVNLESKTGFRGDSPYRRPPPTRAGGAKVY